MAVTLTAEQLAGAIRVETPLEEPDLTIITRLLAVGTALVTEYAPSAPDEIANEATIRISAYIYDQPQSGRAMMFSNAIGNSGAYSLLLPWKAVRVHLVGAE